MENCRHAVDGNRSVRNCKKNGTCSKTPHQDAIVVILWLFQYQCPFNVPYEQIWQEWSNDAIVECHGFQHDGLLDGLESPGFTNARRELITGGYKERVCTGSCRSEEIQLDRQQERERCLDTRGDWTNWRGTRWAKSTSRLNWFRY